MMQSISFNQDNHRINNIYWLSLGSAILLGIIAVTALGFGLIQNNNGLYIHAGTSFVSALAALGAFTLARQNRPQFAAVINILIFVGGGTAVTLYYQGVGIIIGVLIVIVVWQLSYLTLPENLAQYSTLAGATIGIMNIAFGLFVVTDQTFGITTQILILLTTLFYLIGVAVLIFYSYPFYSLRMKFITAVTILTVVTVSITTAVVTSTLRQLFTDSLGTNLQNLAISESATLGEILASEIRSLETLRENTILVNRISTININYVSLSPEEIEAELLDQDQQWRFYIKNNPQNANIRSVIFNSASNELRKFQESFPENTELLLTDRYGGLIAATGLPRDYYQGDESWWREAQNGGIGKTYIGRPTAGETAGVYGIPIVLPIYDTFGEIRGILYINYLLDNLIESVEDQKNAIDSTELLVIIEGEQVLEFPGQNFTLSPININQGATQIPYDQAYVISEIQGSSQFISAAKIRTKSSIEEVNELDWGIVALREQEEALSAFQAQQQIQILIGAIVVLIGSLAAAFIGRLVSEPILDLTKVARDITGGDLDARAEIHSGDEIAILGHALNGMADQVQTNLQELEKRVDERTQALQASFQITRALSTIIYRDDLLQAVVEQLQNTFDYYHVHVYLYNEKTDRLELTSGSGEVSRQLIERGHSLARDQGLVGRAMSRKMAVRVSDVTKDSGWVANELLPETKSELAIPILAGDEVLGVIDIQNNEINSLNEQDQELLQAITNQTAIALRNAAFYEQTRQRAEREQLINLIREKIQTTQNVDTALKTAVRELGQALNSKQTSVRVRTKSHGFRKPLAGD